MTDAPKARIARISGQFIAPGVSANGRLYTQANITTAVEAMRARLVDPDGKPITMMAHHPTFPGGDSRAIVAKVTSVTQEADGGAHYEADVPDTAEARSLLGLVTPGEDGKRYLNNVSIRGNWVGPVETKVFDGRQVTTADELEVTGIDFTQDPGVDETRIRSVILEEATRDAGANRPIVEAAPGDSELVTASEAALHDLAQLVSEAYASICLDNGPADMRISGWTSDPAELKALVGRLAAAGSAALDALDPDADGDIDGIDTPSDGTPVLVIPESAPAADPKEATTVADENKPAEQAAPSTATEAKPAEAAEETKTETALDAEAIGRIAAEAAAAAVTAALEAKNGPAEASTDASEATEAKPAEAAAEAKTEPSDELMEAVRTKLRDELIAEGYVPGRKGLVRETAEAGADVAQKIREGTATKAEMDAYANQAWTAAFSR